MVPRALRDRDGARSRCRAGRGGGAAGEGARRARRDSEVVRLCVDRVEVVRVLDKVDTVTRARDPTAAGRVHSDRALTGLNERVKDLRVRGVRILWWAEEV